MRQDPVVIGALGGSGTRVVARVARAAGLFMGSHLNHAEDSKPVMAFYDAWLRRYLERGGELEGAEAEEAAAHLEARLEEHLEGIDSPSARWGVKVPRSILMLGFWQARFPRFRFVHVIRDGLDMAYSGDRNQLRMVGDLVLSAGERGRDERLQSMAYWRAVNAAAADRGEGELSGRYLRIRFEELCAEPRRVCRQLALFLDAADPDAVAEAGAGEVSPPDTLGRWRRQPEGEIAELARIGGDALARFGYPIGTPIDAAGARGRP